MAFLEISQNSQENTCGRDRLRPANLFKKSLWQRCFPVNLTEFLRTPFLIEHLRWLLMNNETSIVSAFCPKAMEAYMRRNKKKQNETDKNKKKQKIVKNT